uniref:Nonstructural protein n=1 Tax=Tarsiger cyanurus densovirus TaxID=2794546 RepID=A0A8A4XD56_9VIRU|nr:MAG: nonstructural protein [Tarsiger cyanurus densovirus]
MTKRKLEEGDTAPPWHYAYELFKKYKVYSKATLYDDCLASEFRDLCYRDNWKNNVETARVIYVKEQLEIQRPNRWEFVMKLIEGIQPDPLQWKELYAIFDKNRINVKEFSQSVYDLLTCKHFKKNCIKIWGIRDSCKSVIGNCIVRPFITCYMNNKGSENEFYMENMLMKTMMLCEELYITIATAEDFKSILGGQMLDISQKYESKQILGRLPTVVTSNYDRFGRGHLNNIDEQALNCRCFVYNFKRAYTPNVYITWQQFYLLVQHSLF